MAVNSQSFYARPEAAPVAVATPVTPAPKLEDHFKSEMINLDLLTEFAEKSYIVVRTQFEGFHRYPAAPEGVEFLKNEHRHMFHIEAKIEVFHSDRELEFILVKRFINTLLTNSQQDHKSCEMIAESITNALVQKYGKRDITVGVFEDGENGGLYERVYK